MAQPHATPVELNLGPTLGVSYFGIIFSSMLYGLTCLQTFIYFVSASSDPRLVKALVIATIVIDSIHEAFLIHSGYHYSVLNFKNSAALGQVVCLSLRDPRFSEMQKLTGTAVSGLVLGVSADITLAVSLAHYLHRGRSGLKRSDTLINKLILYAVTTGFVPSVNNVLNLIFYVTYPNDFYYQFFNFQVCKLYTNSFLATLNSRASLRSLARRGTFECISLATVGVDPASDMKSSKVMGRGAIETASRSPADTVNISTVQTAVRLGGSEIDFKAEYNQDIESAADVSS
ncbi:hypothetical protein FA95DRAFT_1608375 [Auriscalpium vulgare]|uniref:Uncharacterized protein n=1 Tax=Auriscalpium vulgare TaxID=40419 RepID=A0ACB8RKF2_9AGAM|nr:hypothetical protein FA95DRAFT_1608375 [Auriscalpium vulgare]